MRTQTFFLLAWLLAGSIHSAEKPASEAAIAGFVEQINIHFSAWDQDKNGLLSSTELDLAANSDKTVGNEAAAVATLKRVLNNTKQTPPVLSLENIVKLAKESPPADGPNFPKMYAEGLAKIKQRSNVIFASGTPQMSALHQGRLGDCFCLAPLGAMLHRDPSRVAEMFHVQADGKCDVTLGKQTITVAMPTDTEMALSASARYDGVWVNLYEKAVGSARQQAKPEKDRARTPLDALAHGGSAGTVLALITGHDITRFSCAPFKDEKKTPDERFAKLKELREKLGAAVREKRLVTCGTTTPSTPGLTPHHAYAVLDFDEKADTLQLWNPHGTNFTPREAPGLAAGYPRKDGIFSMPLEAFVLQFSGLAFESVSK